MIVKYYGFGELADPKNGYPYRNASIGLLHSTSTQFATRYLNGTPSACVWLVPGTFDLEGRHVG